MRGDVIVGQGGGSRLSSTSSESYGQPMATPVYRTPAVGGQHKGGGAVRRGASLEDTPIKIPKAASTEEKVAKEIKNGAGAVPTPPEVGSRLKAVLAGDASTVSTPGSVPLPPNPPPTPEGGVGGVPIPPPPPPALSGPTQAHLKRVNWEKLHGAEGTIWKEVSPGIELRCLQSQGR